LNALSPENGGVFLTEGGDLELELELILEVVSLVTPPSYLCMV
jgi:hypothetical protein